MDRERTDENQISRSKLPGTPITQETKVPVTGLLRWLDSTKLRSEVEKLNRILEPSNTDDNLAKGIKEPQKSQVEEKKNWWEGSETDEKKELTNPEEEVFFSKLKAEKTEKTFREIAEKKGITPNKLKTSVERIKAKQEEPISVLPQPPRKTLGTIINSRKSMTEINEAAGEKIRKLQQQDEIGGEGEELPVEKVEKPEQHTSISPATSTEAYNRARLIDRIKEAKKREGTPETPSKESFVQKLKRFENAKKEF